MRFQRPPPLEGNIPTAEKYERWRDWKALNITGSTYNAKQKVGLLYTSVGPETQKVIQLLQLPPQDKGSVEEGREYERLSKGLNDFFRGMVDESVDHNRFYDAKQLQKESIHEYTFRLRTLAMTINIEPSAFAFKLQFLKGMRHRELAIKSSDENTALKDVIQAAARREQREAITASNKQSFFREAEQTSSPLIAKLQGEKKYQGFKRTRGASSEGSFAKKQAMLLLRWPTTSLEEGKPNHFAKVCQQGKKDKPKSVNNIEENEARETKQDDVRSNDFFGCFKNY